MQFSPEQRKEIEKRIERSAKFQRVLGGKEGEFVLGVIDENTGYKGNCFDPDPYINAYKAGQRSISVFIHNILEQDIEKSVKLLDKEITK